MNQTDNPYQSPKIGTTHTRRGGINWRLLAMFNAAVFGTLVMLVSVCAAWSWLQWKQMEQALGRRYVSYDPEYSVHVDWVAGAAIIVGIFVIANIGFFMLRPLIGKKLNNEPARGD